jgi:hypothetical protein
MSNLTEYKKPEWYLNTASDVELVEHLTECIGSIAKNEGAERIWMAKARIVEFSLQKRTSEKDYELSQKALAIMQDTRDATKNLTEYTKQLKTATWCLVLATAILVLTSIMSPQCLGPTQNIRGVENDTTSNR